MTDSESLEQQFQAALQRHQQGDLDGALALYQLVIRTDPNHVGAVHLSGIVYQQQGDLDRAVEWLRRSASLAPDHPGIRCDLGLALIRQNRLDDARQCFEDAVSVDPNNAMAHCNLGLVLRKQGQFDGASQALETALELDPGFAPAHHELGELHLATESPADADAAFVRALELHPGLIEAHLGRASAALAQTETDAALAHAENALNYDPKRAQAHWMAGEALHLGGHPEASMERYRQALEIDPDYVSALNSLGLLQAERGEFEAALASFDRALELDPDNSQVRFNRSVVDQREADDREIDRIRQQLNATSVSDDDESMLRFSLGRLLDSAGEFGEAFEEFRRANELVAEPFNRAAFDAIVQDSMDSFPPGHEFPQSDQEVDPVFIVGLPRSGTTLMEQILSSHPSVIGAGELEGIPRIVDDLRSLGQGNLAEGLRKSDPEELAERYRHSRPVHEDAARVVDKMPSNVFHVGLIFTLFPRATVFHSLRSPLDTAVSCYFQNFSRRLPFTNSLLDFAYYYRGYRQVVAHWEAVLPGRFHTVNYEDVVADQEGQTRRLIEAIELPWDDACLRFFENRRSVKTASLWQVRQPIYNKSVGRWRNYEEQLQPLIEALGTEWAY